MILREMAASIGEDGVAEMATLFRAETADRLARLADAGRETAADLREIHSLKGAAATVGAERIADMAQKLESRLRSGGSLAASDVPGLTDAFTAWQAGWLPVPRPPGLR